MFRVDFSNSLSLRPNLYGAQARYPNPFSVDEFDPDDFESDEFRMFSFKIKKCPLNRAHDWTICPYAHRGERARRRDPRCRPYVAVACPDFRAMGGLCPRGDLCEFAHGVFEYWLHPAKYRTRACTAGRCCTRPVCFFAHSPEELRPEPTHQLTKWARLALRARAQESSYINGASDRGGSGAITRPDPRLVEGSSSSGTSPIVRNSHSMELKLLEGLRRLGINDYDNYYNNQLVIGKNNISALDFEAPNVDWVSDLLAG